MPLFALALCLLSSASDRLLQICRLPAVSGHEEQLADFLERELRVLEGVEVVRDSMGSVVASHGKGRPRLLFAATLDEAGYLVSGVDERGYLRLRRLANAPARFDAYHEGQPVLVLTESSVLPGVVACRSTHLVGRDEKPAPSFSMRDCFVDVGARSRDEVFASGVRLLDPVCARKYPVRLADDSVAAPAAGDRAACLALVELMRRAAPGTHAGKITCAFLAQEKTGLRGTDRLRTRLEADETFLLRGDLAGASGELPGQTLIVGGAGGGKLIERARALDVPCRAREGLELPDASYTRAKLPGTPTILGPVIANAGTLVERVQAADVTRLVDLLSAVGEVKNPDPLAPVAASLPPGNDTEAARFDDELETILAQLVNTYGVSGREGAVARAIEQWLPSSVEVHRDAAENLIVDVGQGRPHLLFVAHMDEVGCEIKAIREDGLVELARAGGFFESLLQGQPALVHTRETRVPAIVLPADDPGSRSGESAPRLLADPGARSAAEVARLGIAVGDTLTWWKSYRRLLSGRANGRSFDDRVGCAALLGALRQLIPQRLRQRVTFAFVVQEEVGLKGSLALAENLQPDYVFAIDTFVSSDSPREDPFMAYAPIGCGAVLRAVDNSNITPRKYVEQVEGIAAGHNLPLQIGTTAGGNDGHSFLHTGAVDVPLSWPLRYSHSPAEVIDLADVHALSELCLWLAYEFKDS
jgi:putative aminopeptidase FrvX